jgi:hypothetical protein
MNEYILTFGAQYGVVTEHPVSTQIHADGWVIVQAATYDDARELVVNAFGTRWSSLYTHEEWDDTDCSASKNMLFPQGEIGRIDSNGILTLHGERV